jgi:GMP synthase-like glutamine amidotransferase
VFGGRTSTSCLLAPSRLYHVAVKTGPSRTKPFYPNRAPDPETSRLGIRILVIQNAEWEGPGLIGLYARAAGVDLASAKLFKRGAHGSRGAKAAPGSDGAIPLDEIERDVYSAVVGLGSPSTAYLPESNPHHKELVQLFKLVRKRKIPSFSICYSMQLFSLVHGGKVIKNPAGKEVGFQQVSPTHEGESDPVIGPVGPHTTLQWHGDIVEQLPPGAIHLASSSKTQNQMAVLDGIHYMLQGDGQAATPSIVRTWLKHDADWATQGTDLKKGEFVRQAVEHQAYLRNTFLRIFGNYLALVLQSSR